MTTQRNPAYDPGNFAAPMRIEEDVSAPWGNVAREAFHKEAYPHPIEIMTMVLGAALKDPSNFVKTMFPMIPFDGETFRIEYWTANISAYGPYAPGAPFEELHVRRDAYQGVMTGFGKQYRIDEDLYDTPIEGLFRRLHMQQMVGGMQYTFMLLIMRGLLGCPTIHMKNDMLLRQSGMSKEQRINAYVGEVEKLTGVFSQRKLMVGADRLLAAVQKARRSIVDTATHRATEANYIIVPASCIHELQLTLTECPSIVTDYRAKALAEYVNGLGGLIPDGEADWGALLDPTMHPVFAGLKTHSMDRVETDDGTGDLMESGLVVNSYVIWNAREYGEVQLIDHEQRNYMTIWKSGDQNYPVGTTLPIAQGGAGCGYLIAMRQISLRTKKAIVGRAHTDTGALLVGAQRPGRFRQNDLRRDTTTMYFRAAFALFQEDAQCVLPDVEFCRYICGGRATIRVVPPTKGPSSCVYHGDGSYLAYENLYTALDSRRMSSVSSSHDVYMYAIPADQSVGYTAREPTDPRFSDLRAPVPEDRAAMGAWLELRANALAELKDATEQANQGDIVRVIGLLQALESVNPGRTSGVMMNNVAQRTALPLGIRDRVSGPPHTILDAAPTDLYIQHMDRIMTNQIVNLGNVWNDAQFKQPQSYNFFPLLGTFAATSPGAASVHTYLTTPTKLTPFDDNFRAVCIQSCVC